MGTGIMERTNANPSAHIGQINKTGNASNAIAIKVKKYGR
jgi:hypothetical protein